MSLLIRKLVLYEKMNIEKEEAKKIDAFITNPADNEFRKNVQKVLEQLDC